MKHPRKHTQNSLKLQIQLAACSEQKEKGIWRFNSTLQWLKLPKFTNIRQKSFPKNKKHEFGFTSRLAKKKRRFSCPRRFGSASTAAAEASNTSEGPDEKVEASFRHSPVTPPKKGVLIDRMMCCWKNLFFFKIWDYTKKSWQFAPGNRPGHAGPKRKDLSSRGVIKDPISCIFPPNLAYPTRQSPHKHHHTPWRARPAGLKRGKVVKFYDSPLS